MNYYNEHDPKKAAWLRELIARNVIAPGVVDERSILDVQPRDLTGYRQCHFFAGIGIWSYALRCAGVGDGEEVWTGSCPCQPFSVAGKGEALNDERHLLPAWSRLIAARRPGVVFGEQVSDGDGLVWLDALFDCLDPEGYTIGAVDSSAAGYGAPIRSQRLYFAAETNEGRQQVRRGEGARGVERLDSRRTVSAHIGDSAAEYRDSGNVAEAAPVGRREERPDCGRIGSGDGTQGRAAGLESGGNTCELGPADGAGREALDPVAFRDEPRSEHPSLLAAGRGPVNGFWRDAGWVWCRDGKWRPVECFPESMADGLAADLGCVRVGGGYIAFPLQKGGKARTLRLRGYGDAIVGPQAEAFIRAYYDARRSQ